MDKDLNHEYWKNRASSTNSAIFATSNNQTIKKLEVSAILQSIKHLNLGTGNILEVGCGQGINLYLIKESLPTSCLFGFDYVKEMILEGAKIIQDSSINLSVGDIRDPGSWPNMCEFFDIIFSVRSLINLASAEEQLNAIGAMVNKLANNGAVILVENFKELRDNQNSLRELAGLPKRPTPEFNEFLTLEVIEQACNKYDLKVALSYEHAYFHDLIVYLMDCDPKANLNYDSLWAKRAARLDELTFEKKLTQLRGMGQALTLVLQRR